MKTNVMQKTVASSVHLEGVGLHTGHKVSLTIKPAGPNEGLSFVRADLPSSPRIVANIDNVFRTNRGTSLSVDGVEIHTVEHALATLTGLGIDNAILEVTADELPIMDGSAQAFCEAIQRAGIVSLNARRKVLQLTKPVFVSKGDMFIAAFPYDGFRLSFKIEYEHDFLKEQSYGFSLSEESFVKDIAAARTFCFDYEIEQLRELGLIKGGSLDNAIVVTKDGVLNESLRFPDECVRHKILDLIGDLTLLGQGLSASVVAIKAGHGMNVELVKALKAVSEGKGGERIGGMDLDAIKKIIPHRHPFLLIDRILHIEDNKKAIGFKNVSGNEEFFQGHFPGHPVMPGVLIVEALAQTAAVLMLRKEKRVGKIAYFMSLDNVKFRKPVFPSDQLMLEVEILRVKTRVVMAKGRAFVAGDLVTESEFKFGLVDR
jgi:UDP-3-O-[3-hydroxymyristoyl] N-acetylglucosamine deacetylase/3-hydroxyacyl-[acyl-carrier-protein] dehydratase